MMPTTARALAERIDDLLVAPRCYDLLDEGTWSTWTAELTGLEAVPPGTISRRIIARAGLAWLYGLYLTRILGGEPNADPDYGADARAVVAAFEGGRPLYIGVLDSTEPYRSYAVGSDPPRVFTASTHLRALEQAGDWFRALRGREIRVQKGRARSLRLSPLAVDLLVGALTHLGRRAAGALRHRR
jgi:hypothetical protein